MASRSGENYEDVLKGMLAHIHETVVPKPCPLPVLREVDDTSHAHSTDPFMTEFLFKQAQVTANAAQRPSVPLVSAATSPGSQLITVSDLNQPGVQKIVVEHLVHTSDLAIPGNSPLRLRVFSGRTPRPPNEVDYETWRTSAELLFPDPTVSDFHRVRRICESRLSPAADMVKSVGPAASPSTYIQLLDSAFAPIKDGDVLLPSF